MAARIAILLGILILLVSLYLCRDRLSFATRAATPASISVTIQDSVILEGAVASESVRSAIVQEATSRFTGRRVIDRLLLDPTAKADWLGSIGGLFEPDLGDGTRAAFDGKTVRLSGAVASDSLRAAIGTAVAASFGASATIDNRLTVVRAAKRVQQRIDKLLNLEVVEFATGSGELTANGTRVLDEVALALEEAPATRVEVVGHTDDRGNPESNRALSQARAEATIAYLASRGLPRDRFTARGAGADEPTADNATSEGRQRNRRIAFTVQEAQ